MPLRRWGRWWAAFVVGLHRGARGEWEHRGTGWLGLSYLRRFDLAAPWHFGVRRVVPCVVEPSKRHPR